MAHHSAHEPGWLAAPLPTCPPSLPGDFWAKAIEPVTELLARNNLTAADLAGIQLLGGTSRVPRIKQALSEALGGRSLDM